MNHAKLPTPEQKMLDVPCHKGSTGELHSLTMDHQMCQGKPKWFRHPSVRVRHDNISILE